MSILAWILNTYKEEELMGHPDLKQQTASLDSLLPLSALNNLQDQYLKVR